MLPVVCPESAIEQLARGVSNSSVLGEGENVFSSHFLHLYIQQA